MSAMKVHNNLPEPTSTSSDLTCYSTVIYVMQ